MFIKLTWLFQDDDTPILVCKKAAGFFGGPLGGNIYNGPGQYYNDHHGPANKHHGPDDRYRGPGDYHGRSYASTLTNLLHLWNTRIINSFGDDRFDSDKWYVMGIGHGLNSCDYDDSPRRGDHGSSHHSRPHQVFTPVESYLSFIHLHLKSHTSTAQDTPDLYAYWRGYGKGGCHACS